MDVPGLAPTKLQLYDVGVLVPLPDRFTTDPLQGLVLEADALATGKSVEGEKLNSLAIITSLAVELEELVEFTTV